MSRRFKSMYQDDIWSQWSYSSIVLLSMILLRLVIVLLGHVANRCWCDRTSRRLALEVLAWDREMIAIRCYGRSRIAMHDVEVAVWLLLWRAVDGVLLCVSFLVTVFGWRRLWCSGSLLGKDSLVCNKVGKYRGGVRHVCGSVLLGEDLGRLVKVLAKVDNANILLISVVVVRLWAAKNTTSKSKCSTSHDRRLGRDEIPVIQCDFTDVPCHMF